jgi:tight adherence protein B
MGSGVAFAVPLLLFVLLGLPLWMAMIVATAAGLGLPRLVLNILAKRRIAQFVTRFPDAIELLVRGLRAGLPIAETMGAVASEIEGPVGSEFQAVSDRMRIGRTLEGALQETADRLGTAEFQFFVITLAIQRETGGNLAETLENLADVLRKRRQMKLKVRAMSSEARASAMIIGSLPFIMMGILLLAPDYITLLFTDPRGQLVIIGAELLMLGGVLVMAKMVRFEI